MVFDTGIAFMVDRVCTITQTGMTGGLCNDQLLVHPALSSKTLNVDFFTSFSEISLIFEISPLQAVLLILSVLVGVCACVCLLKFVLTVFHVA